MYYLNLAQNEDIAAEAHLDIPEDTRSIPAIDLCVVVGNLLENALEACQRMKSGKKFIHIRSVIEGNAISFVVTNSFDGNYRKQNDVYLSLKAEEKTGREGVGLSSVKAICQNHDGLVCYGFTGDVWESSALLNMYDSAPIKSKNI